MLPSTRAFKGRRSDAVLIPSRTRVPYIGLRSAYVHRNIHWHKLNVPSPLSLVQVVTSRPWPLYIAVATVGYAPVVTTPRPNASVLKEIQNSSRTGIVATKLDLEQSMTTEGRCNILPVATLRLLREVRPRGKWSITTIPGVVARDTKYDRARDWIDHTLMSHLIVLPLLHFTQDPYHAAVSASQKPNQWESWGHSLFTFNIDPTAAAVRIYYKQRNKKKNKAGIKRLQKAQVPAINGTDSQYMAQMTVNETTEEISKKPWNELYQDFRSFSEAGEISLVKSKNRKVSVSIGIDSSRMHRVVCVIGTSAGANLVRADVLDPAWLDSIRQRDMPVSELHAAQS